MMKLFDYIFFARPVLFPPVWTIFILGVRAADIREGASPLVSTGITEVDWSMVYLLVLSTFLCAGVYTFNQIHDIESDRKNSKLFFLAEDMIPVRSAYIYTILLDLTAVLGAFLISTRMGLLFAAAVALGILYSHPVTNFKGKPSPGYWSNALGHGMAVFLIGWAYIDRVSLEAAIKSVPYICGVGAIYLNTTLPDREGDKAAGKITHGVRWGIKSTMAASTTLLVLSVILSQMVGDYAFLISAVIALPFFVLAANSRKMEHIALSTRVAILALSAFACIYFPPYLVVLFAGFFAARLYYRARFKLDYPALK